jgi:hypothetical protein
MANELENDKKHLRHVGNKSKFEGVEADGDKPAKKPRIASMDDRRQPNRGCRPGSTALKQGA